MDTLKRVGYCILAILIAAVIYGWSLWYYGGLYQSGALLSASQVTAETLLPTLSQELIVVLPEILAAVIAWALLGWKQFPQEMGLKAESVKKEILSLLAGGYLRAVFGLADRQIGAADYLLPMGILPVSDCTLGGIHLSGVASLAGGKRRCSYLGDLVAAGSAVCLYAHADANG